MATRKEAIAANLPQYNTGKPCKHGHITYRYTSSGACSACIHGAVSSSRAVITGTMHQMRSARNEALSGLVDIKVRCWHQSAAQVRDIAAAICLGRYPALSRADVVITAAAISVEGGSGLYRVKVPQDQVELMTETAKAIFFANSPPVDFSQVHARLNAVQKALDNEGAPPAWTEKP